MSNHPQYRFNTIQEALCEFRLVPDKAFAWTPKLPGQLFKALDYEGMEPINEMGFEVTIDQKTGQAHQRIVEGPPKVKFSNAEDSEAVQVSPTLFVYNKTKGYGGWDAMQRNILSRWGQVSPYLPLNRIARIGLRYINAIPVKSSDRIDEWLKASDFIPAGISKANGALIHRIEVQLDAANRIIVHVVRTPEDMTKVFFDIDRVREINSIPNTEELNGITRELHDDIWEVFHTAQSDQLKRLLEEGI